MSKNIIFKIFNNPFFLCNRHEKRDSLFNAKAREDVRLPAVSKRIKYPTIFDCSTSQIIGWVEAAPPGATIAIATELNLVRRLNDEHPDKEVVFLDDTVCFCATMNRIDLPHLTWVLEHLVEGDVVNEVRVDDETRRWARVALDRMLSLPGDDASLIQTPAQAGT